MACDAQTLLDDASCFLCLGEKQLDTVIVQQLSEWYLRLSPSADVTPQGLLSEASCLLCLETKQLTTIQTQLLCNLSTGSSCSVATPTDLEIFGSSPGADWVWVQATDPAQDFLLEWGTISGGPYASSQTALASDRTIGIVDVPGSYFGVITARDSDTCVSDPSSEVPFTIT